MITSTNIKNNNLIESISKTNLKSVPDTGKNKKKSNYSNKVLHKNRASNESLRKTSSRLEKNNEALISIYDIGLTPDTIDYFKLGLSSPYTNKDNIAKSDSLIFPIRTSDGVFTTPNANYKLKDITTNPTSDYWISGDNRCNYNTARTSDHELLFICDDHKDMWMIHQSIQSSDLAQKMLLITPTDSSYIPDEILHNPKYFEGFTRVFVGFKRSTNGNNSLTYWHKLSGPKTYYVQGVGKSSEPIAWVDYFKSGHTLDDFASLLSHADPIELSIIKKTPDSVFDYQANKIYSYSPIDISGTYHNGFLYYPMVAHETFHDPESGTTLHNKTTVIIRSDGKTLQFRELPSSSKTNSSIFALSDGTIIDGPPRVPLHPSWNMDQANAWIEGKAKPRSIDLILKDIFQLLKSRVWLPYPEDYTVLGLTSVITYMQEAFDAVPLILMEGAAGTGKTDTTEVMSSISCNGTVVSESSAATITRTIEAARGFIALDDIEKIAKNVSGKNAASSDDLIQVLKTSYKKVSSKRNVTDPKTMAVQVLNFFGVKMMSNTSGIDEILGTRTLKIHTRKAPPGKFKSKEFDPAYANQLRFELHAWAMENINQVYDSYIKLDRDDRISEICAPLRAVANQAKRSDSNRYNEDLNTMIERRRSEDNSSRSPSDVAQEALMRLIGLGYQTTCLEQIVMEMSLIVPTNYQKDYSTDIPEWRDHQWLKRILKQLNLISSSGIKFRPFGNSSSRLYQITSEATENYSVIRNDLPKEDDVQISQDGDGKMFCKRHSVCKSCRYVGVDCDIRIKTKRF